MRGISIDEDWPKNSNGDGLGLNGFDVFECRRNMRRAPPACQLCLPSIIGGERARGQALQLENRLIMKV